MQVAYKITTIFASTSSDAGNKTLCSWFHQIVGKGRKDWSKGKRHAAAGMPYRA
jgi:hypothetical protein